MDLVAFKHQRERIECERHHCCKRCGTPLDAESDARLQKRNRSYPDKRSTMKCRVRAAWASGLMEAHHTAPVLFMHGDACFFMRHIFLPLFRAFIAHVVWWAFGAVFRDMCVHGDAGSFMRRVFLPLFVHILRMIFCGQWRYFLVMCVHGDAGFFMRRIFWPLFVHLLRMVHCGPLRYFLCTVTCTFV